MRRTYNPIPATAARYLPAQVSVTPKRPAKLRALSFSPGRRRPHASWLTSRGQLCCAGHLSWERASLRACCPSPRAGADYIRQSHARKGSFRPSPVESRAPYPTVPIFIG
jgi:hypothetical protein